MRCPCCKSELRITHYDHYNVGLGLNRLDEGYQCVNSDCVSNSFQVSWNSKGEIFYRDFILQNKIVNRIISKFSEDNITNAIDSESRKYENAVMFSRVNTRKIKIGKYSILIQPYYKDLDCKKVRRVITFEKNDEQIITWFYLSSYIIKQFLHNYNNKRYRNCIAMIIDDSFKQKTVYKITMMLIRFIYYKKYRIVKNYTKDNNKTSGTCAK